MTKEHKTVIQALDEAFISVYGNSSDPGAKEFGEIIGHYLRSTYGRHNIREFLNGLVNTV